jgi:DHA1 family multidrug resistance protein-like MFS transporter
VVKTVGTGITGMVARHNTASHEEAMPKAAVLHFSILLLAVLSVSMAYGVTLPILPFIIERAVGADAASVAWHTGALAGLYTLALFVMGSFWGALSDRIGRRPVIALGLVGSSVGLILLDAATTLPALYVARGLSGALSAAVLPAVLACVAESSQALERPRRFALTAAATTFGFLLGPALGSGLSAMAITPPSGMRIGGILMPDSPFFVAALAGFLIAIAIGFLRSEDKSAPATGDTVDLPTAADRSRMRLGLLLTCVTVFGITIAEVGITLLGKQVLSLDPQGIARFFLICGVVMILVQIGGFSACMQWFALPTLLIASLIIVTTGLALIAVSRSAGLAMLAFALVSAGTAILIPALATLISEAAGSIQGKAMGQQASSANLGQALAASLTGVLFLAAPAAPFIAGAAATAAAIALVRRLPENTTNTPEPA